MRSVKLLDAEFPKFLVPVLFCSCYKPLDVRRLVGPSGIEPDLHAPEACVLPVYYGPLKLRHHSTK